MTKSLSTLLLGDHLEIAEALVASDGEITPELEAKLDAFNEALPQKVDSIIFILDFFHSQVELQAELEQRHKDKKDWFKNANSRLRDYVKSTMLKSGMRDLKGVEHRFKLSTTTKKKLVVPDETKIPAKFFREEIVWKLCEEDLADALMRGEEIPGASIEEVEVHTLRDYSNKLVHKRKDLDALDKLPETL